jgi:hypothetical protein
MMTINDANSLPIVKVLEKLAFQPIEVPQHGNDVWYISPFRPKERAANFHVDMKRNIWYDFVTNTGGSTLDFVKYFRNCDESAALDIIGGYFRQMDKMATSLTPQQSNTPIINTLFVLNDVKPLTHPSLLAYILEEKRINTVIAKKYLVEVAYTHTEEKKSYYAAAMENESGGYEVRNKYFEGFLGKKDLTILRGGTTNENTLSIFMSLLDFLSAVEYYGATMTNNDVIILHHADFLQKAMDVVENNKYQHIFTYFGNDDEGQSYVKAFKKSFGRIHEPCHGFYYPFDNFNAYWQHFRGKK